MLAGRWATTAVLLLVVILAPLAVDADHNGANQPGKQFKPVITLTACDKNRDKSTSESFPLATVIKVEGCKPMKYVKQAAE